MGFPRSIGYVFFLLLSISLWAQSESSKPADKPSGGSTASQPASQTEAPPPATEKSPAKPGDSTQLEPLHIGKPVYPAEAAQKGLQGQVWVKVYVSETGDVEKVQVVSGDSVLAKAAVDAATKWKFKPFIQDGKPIKASTEIPVNFAFSKNISDKEPPAPPGTAKSPARIVIPTVKEGLLVHKVAPVYPIAARERHIEGAVVLRALIGKDGRIHQLTPISGPKELVDAAIGAVQQWRYKPYFVDNEPVEVSTQITVNFRLQP